MNANDVHKDVRSACLLNVVQWMKTLWIVQLFETRLYIVSE
jgi:hypothetical protein